MDTMSFQDNYKYTERGYNSWYDECTCCPYGYHIDLDFVRYCESIGKESDRSGSIKRRKDRRRQRQSMEVLLGITPPVMAALEQNYGTILEQQSPKIVRNIATAPPPVNLITHQSSFDDAVTDFEKTLQRSKNKHYNLPDVTAVIEMQRIPSDSSMSSASSMTVLGEANNNNKDFDTVSIESNLSPFALQNIREQMAISLERTKQLEDQVKLIPDLKEQVSSLKEENRRLQLKLKLDQSQLANFVNNYSNRIKSQSFTNIDALDSPNRLHQASPPRKDFGVTCTVLTRTIGVGNQKPHTRSVATVTVNDTADKWLKEKSHFIGTHVDYTSHNRIVPKPEVIHNSTQTKSEEKSVQSRAVSASPTSSDFCAQKTVDTHNVGIGDNSITEIHCPKCSTPKKSIGTGPESVQDSHCPISLSLLGSKSKSFNLGEDRLNFTRKRTIGSQYEPTGVHKSSQSEPNQNSKGSQCQVKQSSKATQLELERSDKKTQYDKVNLVSKLTDVEGLNAVILATKLTDTSDLPVKEETKTPCPTASKFTDTRSLSAVNFASKLTDTNDLTAVQRKTSKSTDTKGLAEVKLTDTKSPLSGGSALSEGRDEAGVSPSRIPRLQQNLENRKFRRQDTYTKVYAPPNEQTSSSLRLSGLDLSPKPSGLDHQQQELVTSLEKVKQNLSLPDISQDEGKNAAESTSLPQLETPSTQQPRHKAVPSKEMRGAMKVLHDSLQKSQTKNPRSHNAISIIQKEWFKISSLVTANPLDVEDYLDVFEEVSSILLEYIVNMTDESGNTAMHYAVSHGNFDVVSILLDSKVCDINKPNKAGYTCVMLVSLAEIRSQTHANVIRRLFQLADVNIRAKQHGQTALMLAVSHGRLDMVTMLIEAGADINIQDDDGSTALMCASEHGHIEIVKHFLSQPDCDSSITDIDGSNALKIAMEAGHRHIGVLLYAHQRSLQLLHGKRKSKSKPSSPKTPSSPLPIRSSHRALTDTKHTK